MIQFVLSFGYAIGFALLLATLTKVQLQNSADQFELNRFQTHPFETTVSSSLNLYKKKEAKQVVAEQVDQINNWKLIATVIGSPSMAMLINGSETTVLKMNARLEGYSLQDVEKERALFDRRGKQVWLYIHSKENQKKFTSKNVNSNQLDYSLPRKRLTNAFRNPEKLLQDVSIVPEIKRGKTLGFRINNLRTHSFLWSNGLRKNDIITAVNGKKLQSASDGLKYYQQLMRMDNFTISVLRNNKEEVITYEVR